MMQDSGDVKNGLSTTFTRLLMTAVSMPLVSVIGGTMAFYFSPGVGRFVVAAAMITGIAALVACMLLRISGRHRAAARQGILHLISSRGKGENHAAGNR